MEGREIENSNQKLASVQQYREAAEATSDSPSAGRTQASAGLQRSTMTLTGAENEVDSDPPRYGWRFPIEIPPYHFHPLCGRVQLRLVPEKTFFVHQGKDLEKEIELETDTNIDRNKQDGNTWDATKWRKRQIKGREREESTVPDRSCFPEPRESC